MEGIALVLIGAVMFSHAWHLLRLYPDGRTMGVFVGVLGLASLITITFDPVLLTGLKGSNMVVENNIFKLLVILWAGYAIGVAAQGIWELDERAIGFYSFVVSAASIVALIYYAANLFPPYGNQVMVTMVASTFFLAVPSAAVFFYYAVPVFAGLQLVAGWFLMVGGVGVLSTGLVIASSLVHAKG